MKGRFLLLFIGFVLLSWMMHGCCACDDKKCPDSRPPTISILLDLNDSDHTVVEANRDYTVTRTTRNSETIDMYTDRLANSDSLWYATLVVNTEIRDSGQKLIVEVPALDLKDTISNVSFEVNNEETFCANCTFPCRDRTTIIENYHNTSLRFNGVLQNSFEIKY